MVCITAVLISVGVYFSSIGDKTIFPNTGEYTFEYYTDESNGGNSEVTEYIISDSILTLDFVLKDGFQSPYIGLSITPLLGDYIDASEYNQLDIEVSGKNVDRIGVSFYTPPLDIPEINNTYETLYNSNLNISNIPKEYHIPIAQFRHPDWWEDLMHIPPSKRNNPDLNKILHINLGSAYSSEAGNEKTLNIYSITFSRNNNMLFLMLGLLYLLGIVLNYGIIYFLKHSSKKTKNVLVTYNPLELKNKTGDNEKSIEYINENYDNGDLTLEVVSNKTGVSTRYITQVIHEKFGCNFKTYINQIRINESKRFLTQTDLNIGEIAYKVGFNNQSHFNRVFKKELGISPSEYRNHHTGKE